MNYPSVLRTLVLLVIGIANQSYAETTIIRAARMIDVTTGELISPAVVVVEGNRIAAVNPESLPSANETIELGDRTLLPGLFDMHTHVTLDYYTGQSLDDRCSQRNPGRLGTVRSQIWSSDPQRRFHNNKRCRYVAWIS